MKKTTGLITKPTNVGRIARKNNQQAVASCGLGMLSIGGGGGGGGGVAQWSSAGMGRVERGVQMPTGVRWPGMARVRRLCCWVREVGDWCGLRTAFLTMKLSPHTERWIAYSRRAAQLQIPPGFTRLSRFGGRKSKVRVTKNGQAKNRVKRPKQFLKTFFESN